MKSLQRIIFALIMALALFAFAACSDNTSPSGSAEPQQSESTPPLSPGGLSSESQHEAPQEQPSAEPQNDNSESTPLVTAVQGIIGQYKNGTVDTETGEPGSPGPDFTPVPEDFVFPSITGEADFERVNRYEDIFVYIKGSGELPYMNICVNPDDYTVESVIFLPSLPEAAQSSGA